MKIKVLGSSGSVAPGQNTAAFLIDDHILLDAGTVSRYLDQKAQLRITHIFLTHAHLDHIKGIPFLVDNLAVGKQKRRVKVLSGREVIRDLKKYIFNNHVWPDFTTIPNPDHPFLRFQEISSRDSIKIGPYRFLTTPVTHTVPAYGYIVEDAAGKALAYTGDSGPTEKIWNRFTGLQIKGLIIEVSFPNSLKGLALRSGHLTPSLLKKEIQKMPVLPEKLYITHPKLQYRKTIEKELATLRGIPLAILEDGMEIQI
jgi:ribonuclease BN (tRNA processing enzyme)